LSTPPPVCFNPNELDRKLSQEASDAPGKAQKCKRGPEEREASDLQQHSEPGGSAKRKKLSRKEDPVEKAKSKKRGKENVKRKKKNRLGALLCQDSNVLETIARKQAARHFKTATENPNKNEAPASELRESSASTGYIGKPRAPLPAQKWEYMLEELHEDGTHNFQLIKKANYTQYVPCPKDKKIHVVITPGPKDKKWEGKMKDGASFLKEVAPECKFNNEPGRRGTVNSINYSISMGNRQPKPMTLNDQGVKLKRIMERIRLHPAFISLAGFMSTTFLAWGPLLFLYYADTTGALLEKYPELTLPFYNSIFVAFTVNFGPQTQEPGIRMVCDHGSRQLDYTKGGHLVLWDLKLIIEFPPGYTIFVPSAVVCHLNTAIQPGKEHFSFTMYSAGDLFRWMEHGFQTETDYHKLEQAK
ncbi:hypothetical protein V5O48_018641, partial [Marasmius crinis-equi]